ncbi:Fur-regulated basic protein FbpA [Salirhabdus salicampi]|uniref:Fur-regulated basic protein FbpA n=1 Tax=Salirhabdus salicampi TaxID=476102 RepID=UPI0020C5336F|nr:Fur-regulated basic protein FbpA [Salirhabdus salicampi]MCP8615382.1 Fur-regulated basic protein FbpA [Salirhabdus salicampi]
MQNYLREAVEKLRNYYIDQLIEAGLYIKSDREVYSLTLSELQSIVKKTLKNERRLGIFT